MALECSEGAGSWSLAKDISSGIRSYIALLCCPIYPTLVFDPTDPGQGCWVNVISTFAVSMSPIIASLAEVVISPIVYVRLSFRRLLCSRKTSSQRVGLEYHFSWICGPRKQLPYSRKRAKVILCGNY